MMATNSYKTRKGPSMSDAPKVLTGEVKFFKRQEGYGFITHSGVDKDIFFTKKSLSRNLNPNFLVPGTKVRFKLRQGPKGFNAYNIGVAGRKYKLLVNYDVPKIEGGTFATGIEVGGQRVYLSVRNPNGERVDNAFVFVTWDNPDDSEPNIEEEEEETSYDEDYPEDLFE
jgi:cold shock CspA family protein